MAVEHLTEDTDKMNTLSLELFESELKMPRKCTG